MRAPSAFAYVRETEIHSNDASYRERVPRRENRTRKEFLGPEQLARTQPAHDAGPVFCSAHDPARFQNLSPSCFHSCARLSIDFPFFPSAAHSPASGNVTRRLPNGRGATEPQSHRATEPARVSQPSEPERPHFPLLPGAPTAAAAAARSREFAGTRPPAHPPQLALGNPI